MIHYDMHLGLSDLDDHIERACNKLSPHLDEFDSIVTEGISGLVIAAPVAYELSKPLVVVRKDIARLCIHASPVEGTRDAGRRTLFIDDHVDLGRTLRHVRDQLTVYSPGTSIIGYYEAQYDRLVMG
jgi:adenine/guanine phosphoribosyltransferase-like PRPP-binding protein